jgi:hypothetical protein
MSIPTLEDGDTAPSPDANVALYVPDGIYNTPDAPSEEDDESPGTISAPLTESIQTSLAPSSNMPVLKLCGVCKVKEFKYKCSRCYVP